MMIMMEKVVLELFHFESELTNQQLRKLICGLKLWLWLATMKN